MDEGSIRGDIFDSRAASFQLIQFEGDRVGGMVSWNLKVFDSLCLSKLLQDQARTRWKYQFTFYLPFQFQKQILSEWDIEVLWNRSSITARVF